MGTVLSPAQYILWCLGFPLEAAVVVCSIRGGSFFRYFSLNVFMIGTFAISVGRFMTHLHYGFGSSEYLYFYYYSEALGIILLYFSVVSLFLRVFQEMHVSKYVRGLAIAVLLTTAFVSYLIVRQSASHLTDRFVVELTQNLYFVGLLLIYPLWGAVLKLRETPMRITLFVLSLGIFFSAHAVVYGLRHMFPSLGIYKLIPPILGMWLPLSWLYTFTFAREDSRTTLAHEESLCAPVRIKEINKVHEVPQS